MEPLWYVINARGLLTLCAGENDARTSAADFDLQWPKMAPHRAVQMIEYTPAAAPSAPAPAEVPCPTCGSRSMRIACFRCRPAEVPMPEPDQTDVDCELWGQNSKVDVWYRESVLTYAAGREAAALERVRGVLRELVESYRSLINTLGHEDATAADEEKAEARFACAEAAARAELGEKP